MATTVAVLEAQLRADTSRFDRNINQSESKMSKFGKVAKVGALAAGAGIAYGLGKVAKIGFDEFNEGQKVAAQTNAVIKSTGGVANVTARDVQKLSEALMRKSGVDDEAIATGQNMLLTFKNIRNETGRGNDIFRQATEATLDLSVAMGKDMQSSSIMVGKALNDPIKGITAMRRVGIQFTAAQEDQIKTLVESGHTMKAQKLILKELESQFGGSAKAAGETFGGQINILRERFNNWSGEMVGRAIPVLQRFGQWLMPLVEKAVRIVGDIIDSHVRPAVHALADTIRRNEPQLREIWQNITQIIRTMWKVAGPILRVLFTKVVPFVLGVAIKWVGLYTSAFLGIVRTGERVVQWFQGTFVPFIRQVWDGIRDRVTSRLDRIRDVLALVRNTAKFTFEFFRDKAQLVVEKVGAVIQRLRDMVAYIRSIPGKIAGALGGIGGFFSDLGAGIGGATRRARQGVGDFGSFGLGATSLVALGRQLQSMGFHVAEHPAFGGVGGGHAPGSYHYAGRAIDINWPGGGSMEMAKLDWLNSRLSRMPGVKELLWRTAGHFDHLHLAMAKGGIFTKPWTGMVSVAERGRPEGFVPLPAGGGGLGGLTLNFNAPIYGANESRLAEEIYRLYRRGEASWRQGNGG